MDPLTIYLAKLLGLALLIVGVSLVFKTHDYQDTLKDVSKSNAIMTLISVIPLVVGLSLVLSHNLWIYEWPVVITIIGWVILIAGIIRLFFHKAIMKKMGKCASCKAGFIVIGVIFVIVGAFLAYKGFEM